jgi:hypothetical protein
MIPTLPKMLPEGATSKFPQSLSTHALAAPLEEPFPEVPKRLAEDVAPSKRLPLELQEVLPKTLPEEAFSAFVKR